MDFGILLMAIGYMAGVILCGALLLRWIFFVSGRIQNPVLQEIISLLPLVVFLIILFYHTLASSLN